MRRTLGLGGTSKTLDDIQYNYQSKMQFFTFYFFYFFIIYFLHLHVGGTYVHMYIHTYIIHT